MICEDRHGPQALPGFFNEADNMKRRRLIIALVGALLLGALVVVILPSSEPHFQGRTLTRWISEASDAEMHMANPALVTNDARWLSARLALKNTAPDAIPWLLKLLQTKDSRLMQNVEVWLYEIPILHLRLRNDTDKALIAKDGLRILSEDAKPAWPELIRLSHSPDPEIRIRAFWCLSESKMDKETLMPILIRLVSDPDLNVQKNVALGLDILDPKEAEAAGVYKKFPQLKPISTNQGTNSQ